MATAPLIIKHIHGENSTDAPEDLAEGFCQRAVNVDFDDGSLCRKRNGATDVTLNGFAAATNNVQALGRYVPGDNEAAAELHAVESAALTTMQRLTGGTTWATYALADAIQANGVDTSMVNFNGKFYQAMNTAVNRLHVYPSAGGTHRRVGFEVLPGAPTHSAAGGAVTDTRKYAVCWTEQVSTVTVRRSNIGTKSTAQALAAQQDTLTKPTAPGDGETHWELYAYSIIDNYSLGYLIATTVIGTATAVDNNATLSGAAPPIDGQNTPPPSAKYLITDGSHLIGAGAWETAAGTSITPSTRMVWWTPALGSTVTDGDDERISNTSTIKTYLYVDSSITGIGGPLQGSLYLFGYRNLWKLVPTGDAANAYQRITLRTDIGCIRHQTICIGEDEEGRPAIYWLSAVGPYRYGADGLQYIGRDTKFWWDTINLDASAVSAFSLYHPARHQVWWWICSGPASTPNVILIFDCRRGKIVDIGGVSNVRYGWSEFTGNIAFAQCGVLFSNTLAASMSRDLLPYAGMTTGLSTSPHIYKLDSSATTDAGTIFQATLKTRVYTANPMHTNRMDKDAYVLGKVYANFFQPTLTLTTERDFGAETTTATGDMLREAVGQTRGLIKFEGAAISDATHVAFTIGEAAATDGPAWVLDSIQIPVDSEAFR